MRGDKRAITVFDDGQHIVKQCCVKQCCDAWNVFANDTGAVASITSRSWAEVNG